MSFSQTHSVAVVLTALPVEFKAVLEHLTDVEEVEHPAGTIYEVGTFTSGKGTWTVAVVQIGMGNPRAAQEFERAAALFNPNVAFFVGVAGGLKDVELGDVVAATKVYGFEFGKAEEQFKTRPEFGASSYRLVQRAKSVASKAEWRNQIKRSSPSQGQNPKAYVAPIAAGEKVVASMGSSAYRLLREQFSDALAVEMEGYGFLHAAYANEGIQALVVRGISDKIEGKGEADRAGMQDVAACHAAAFAFEVLNHLSPMTVSSRSEDAGHKPHVAGDQFGGPSEEVSDVWDTLSRLAPRLYPEGPTENQIWNRAGGDPATLNLKTPGRSAWYSALHRLRLGGGGTDISLLRLIESMIEDYPGNAELRSLLDTLT